MFLAAIFSTELPLHQFGIRAMFVRVDIIMPPRRRPNQVLVEEAIERDRMVQLERQVEQLTEQLATMRANQNPFQNLNPETGGDSDGEEEIPLPQRQQRGPEIDEDKAGENIRRWESGMRTEVPEFQGSMQPEEFLEWIGIVEEILEFKRVPEREKVALVATRLRGRAAAWWLRAEFLPHNF